MDIDSIRLNLNQDSINVLKIIIALIMFGVALELKMSDFKLLFKNPRSLIAGLVAQFIIFPFLTYLLIILFNVRPSIALGLAMVAACPAGNLANLITSLSKGNVVISIGITSITTILAMFSMPFMIIFLGKLIPGAEPLLSEVKINNLEMLEGVFVILGIPLILGMTFSKFLPQFSIKLKKIMSRLSVVFLLIFIIGALAANFQHFLSSIQIIVVIVFFHNLLALFSGLIAGKAAKLSTYDLKGVMIPMGVRNTALGLAIVFQFFHGMGGMALVVAWWGINQITLGLILSKLKWGNR